MSLPDPTTAPPWWERHGVEPTTKEMASWLDRTSDANRDHWFQRMRENANAGIDCWAHDHEGRIDYLQRALRKANERIAWLEKHYSGVIR